MAKRAADAGGTPALPGGRCVLEGLARVGFYEGRGAPEDDLLPSCIKSFLQYKGEDLGFLSRRGARDPWHDLHCYLLGTSGCAFRRVQSRNEWSAADGSPFVCTDDPTEPARRALASAGYGCEALLKPAFAAEHGLCPAPRPTQAQWRARIVESIRGKGRPVIAIGVIGPPEPCLITGYDEGGAVLIGWNAFQGMPDEAKGVEFEDSGYFRQRDWFGKTQGLIFIGEKQPRPPAREIHRSALALGLKMLTEPEVKGRLTGQAAFGAWAEQLLDEKLFATRSKKVLGHRFWVHHQRGGDLAEARAFGSPFLRFVAEQHPEAREELLAASRCFDDEHDLVWAIWEFTDGMVTGDEGAKKFASSYVRGRLVPLIRLARTRDADAARHIGKAIEQMDHARWEEEAATLPVNPRATIKREGGAVWIDGLPDLPWGAGRDCTFLGSVEALSSITERPLRYTDMMGATGIAFRLRWSNPDTMGGWDMASPCGEFMEEWDDVQRATGLLLHAEFPGVTQDAAADPNAQRVVRHIDAGWPVMANVDGPNIGLIVGYRDEGRTMLIRRYGTPGIREVSAAAACGGFQLLRGGTEAPPLPKATFAAALRTAVRNWTRERAHAGYAVHGHEWWYGAKAFEVWADDLMSRDPAAPTANGQTLHAMNGWVYGSLVDGRTAAVAYLRDHAPILDGDARAAVLRAADLYEKEVALLSGPIDAGAPWLDPDSHPVAQWSMEQRTAERDMLITARQMEDEAIAELATAGGAMEFQPPAARMEETGQFAVLQGVPRIGYGVHLCPFPGSLYSVLEYIGDPADHDMLMAVTGGAFRRFWEKDDGGNVDLMYLGREPIVRVAAALNREMTVVPHKDHGAMVAALKESISNGRPLIAFGIIGPPEAGIVTGYDRCGNVLYGWSYFQDGSKPGYYQRIDWQERANWAGDMAFVVIGDKGRWPGPSKRDTLLSTMKWAVDLALTERRPETPGHLSGLAAYDAWADGLEVDSDYPKDNAEVMGARVMVHGDQCCMLCDRASAAKYLRAAAAEAPEAEADLRAAADLYEQASNAQTWPWGHDMGPAAQAGLADAAARRAIAGEVRAARAAEAKAVALLHRAVSTMEATMR